MNWDSSIDVVKNLFLAGLSVGVGWTLGCYLGAWICLRITKLRTPKTA